MLDEGKSALLAPEGTLDGRPHDHVVPATPADPTMPWTLVRPDGHLAWRGEPATLQSALDRLGLRSRAGTR